MNKRFLHTCCLIAIFAGGAVAAEDKAETQTPAAAETTAETQAPAVSGDTTVATVNGRALPLDLFRMYYAERLRQANTQNSPAFQNQAFNEFVNIVVTAQDAESKGIEKQKQIGYLLELERMQVLSRAALQNAAEMAQPTEEELQKAYDEQVGKEKRVEYKARRILVKTEDEAKSLVKELDGGADFEKLATEKSLGPTGKTGGDLGWFDANQMVQPFTEAVATMKKGSHSSTPVQTQFGWHVILLEDTRESDPPSLEQVKGELTTALQREKLGAYVAELRNAAKLELNSDLIKMNEDEEGDVAAK
jgi:peptidyl-prolyl cis-trans isomerase C